MNYFNHYEKVCVCVMLLVVIKLNIAVIIGQEDIHNFQKSVQRIFLVAEKDQKSSFSPIPEVTF